jgi:hypothetical protein
MRKCINFFRISIQLHELLNALEQGVHSKFSNSSNGRSGWSYKTLTVSFVPAMISSFAMLMSAGILFIKSAVKSSLNIVQSAEYY